MDFYPVLLQLMWLNCVPQASISTRVNSSTFTRGQHLCALLLLVRGRRCYAKQAICWALPHVSSLFWYSIYINFFNIHKHTDTHTDMASWGKVMMLKCVRKWYRLLYNIVRWRHSSILLLELWEVSWSRELWFQCSTCEDIQWHNATRTWLSSNKTV